MDVFSMSHDEFKRALNEVTTPKEVWTNAAEIYSFLTELFGQSCYDSLMREWAFQWYCEKTGEDYDNIYKRWLEKS